MKLIKLTPFLMLLILFSCNTENEDTSKRVKEKDKPSVFDVTTNTLKAINDLDEKFKHAEELLNKEDTTNIDFKIDPVYFDSSKDTSGLKVIIADGDH